MSVSAEFLDRSEAALKDVMAEFRPKLLQMSGSITTDVKPDSTPVTQLDLEVEAAMRKALKGVDESVGLEGEEHGIEGSRERFWLIDPIDGTEQFIRGIPAYRSMATYVENDELQYTFVYDVPKDELYSARKGQGAFCNGKSIELSKRPPERAMIEYTSRLETPEALMAIGAARTALRGVRITTDFTHTLQGRFEGHMYYRSAGSSWDWTPWALLIAEAGGKVANFGSDKYDWHDADFLAATPEVFDYLKPIMDEALQPKGEL